MTDAREKLVGAIACVLQHGGDTPETVSAELLVLPELESYFREKFENEPGRLVAVRECIMCIPKGKVWNVIGQELIDCPHCHGTGIIKRNLTRKEVEEWAIRIVEMTKIAGSNPWLTSAGEQISIQEKLVECTCDCHKYHNTVLHDGLDNCVCKGTGWVKEEK